MNPDTRFASSLVGALLFSTPALLAVINGDSDIIVVGLKFLVAFLGLFVAIGVVGGLYNSYIDQHEAAAEGGDGDGDVDEFGAPRRRLTDG